MSYIIDTNIFIRHLTGDDPVKSPLCFEIMKKLSVGEMEARISEAVICEICYVLSSRSLQYKLSHQDIRDRLTPLLTLKGLKLPNRKLYLHALDIYSTYNDLDFEDALNVAYMQDEQIDTVLSYDTDFDQIPQINRQEPGQIVDPVSNASPIV